MEKIDLENGAAFRGVALALQERFCPALTASPKAKKATEKERTKTEPTVELPVVINPPLDFDLKGLDYNHAYLRARGFTRDTIDEFGLGFCSRGLLKDRVAIPLHDHEGRLVGYAGRVVDDATISKDNPRYRFPSKRKRDGKVIEFRKALFLYNGCHVSAPADDLIVTEGFASVWWLYQHDYSSSVAAMGADCSEKQAELMVALVKPTGRVWVLSDGDDAGRRFAQSVLLQVSPHRFTRWVKIAEGSQPTDLTEEQLKSCFTT
jgi:DNA primase